MGLTAPFPVDQDRTFGENIGNGERFHLIRFEPAPFQANAGQEGRLDVGAEFLSGGWCPVRLGDDSGFPCAGAGQPLDEKPVDARTDPKAEEVGISQVFPDEIKGLGFHRDIAVGHHHQRAGTLLRSGQLQSSFESRQQVGAPATLLAGEQVLGLTDILRGSGQRFLRQQLRSSGKEQHIEGIGWSKTAQKIMHQLLADFEGKAVHGSGNVDDEKVFARGDLVRFVAPGRLHHEQEEVLLLAFVEQQPRFKLIARQAILEDEVAVAAGLFGCCQGDLGLGGAVIADVHLMGGTGHLLHRHPRGQSYSQIKSVGWLFSLVQGGVPRPFFGRRRRGFELAGVARPHHRWVDEFVKALAGSDHFRILQLGLDFITGKDVGHIHLEHIGTVLFEERGALALLLCLLVNRPRFLTLADFGHDGAFADGHPHTVHRGPGRGRKHVDSLDRFLPGVLVDLSDLHIGDHPGDPDRHRGCFEGELVDAEVITLHQEIGGEGVIVPFRRLGAGNSRPEKGQ